MLKCKQIQLKFIKKIYNINLLSSNFTFVSSCPQTCSKSLVFSYNGQKKVDYSAEIRDETRVRL